MFVAVDARDRSAEISVWIAGEGLGVEPPTVFSTP